MTSQADQSPNPTPRRFSGVIVLLLTLGAGVAMIAAPETARAALYRVSMNATIHFVGCPSSISCSSFPLMWGVSGGEPVTLEIVFDDAIPASSIVDASPDYIAAQYDHALPLSIPLGADVQFGPYSAVAGSTGATPDRYSISVSDDLGSGCCPDIPEAMAVELIVQPQSATLTGPPGFHDLDLRSVRLDFLNYGSAANLLTGAGLVSNFPALGWDERRLTVEVHDPIYDRSGRAFIDVTSVESVEAVTVQGVPTLSPGGAFVLVGSLSLLAWRSASRRARHQPAFLPPKIG